MSSIQNRTAQCAKLQFVVVLITILFAAHVRAQTKPSTSAPLDKVLSVYLNNDDLDKHLHEYFGRCKTIARLTTIGKTVKGRDIYALELSDNPGIKEAKPNVKYVGNLHGNEPTGRILTMALAEWLCANYKQDKTAARILRDMHLWLLPSANPDGFGARKRENLNSIDLNRDFPDRFDNDGAMQPTGKEQPETKAIMDWTIKTGFVASAAFHEGALVANYPWDGTPDRSTKYWKCPDDDVFKHLAKTYANNHRTMSLPTNAEFPKGGITNGAAWYPIYGSMQDWNYIVGRCLELTLEVSEGKWPPESSLTTLWEDNKEAMLKFPLLAAFGGVYGLVTIERKTLRTNKGREIVPAAASITVEGINFTVYSTTEFGDYYRPLAPGTYTITATLKGFSPETAQIVVPEDGTGVKLDFNFVEKTSTTSSDESTTSSSSTKEVVKVQQKLGGFGGKVVARDEQVVLHATRDAFVLIGVGVGMFYCLWLVHRRVVRKSSAAHRSK